MSKSFLITTNRTAAEQIEKAFKSPILSQGRSIKILGISHNEGYSNITIGPKAEDAKINPDDIFWMGFYSGSMEKS